MIAGMAMSRQLCANAVERLRTLGLIHTTTLESHACLRGIPKEASVYAGFDPTARSLHLGNLLAMIALVHFRLEGHPTIALVGGATGRIGDPSWRSTAKDRLDEGVVEKNITGIKGQLESFSDRALHYISTLRPLSRQPGTHRVVDNYSWYEGMSLLSFLDTVGSRARVATLVSRDCVRSRMQSEAGLSFSELTYQLLQAYDYCKLYEEHGCRLQVGGSDQWGNILSGLDLISKLHADGDTAHGLTLPLLVTSSGEKMGKSAGNAVWLDSTLTSPFDLYQYFVDMSDTDALSYLPKLSFRPLERIEEVIAEHQKAPERRIAQRLLAFDVTALVHSDEEAKRSETASDVLFGHQSGVMSAETLNALARTLENSSLLKTLQETEIIGHRLADVIATHENCSKNAARQSIKAGAVYINGHKEMDIHTIFAPEHFLPGENDYSHCLIRTGKQTFILLRISNKMTNNAADNT